MNDWQRYALDNAWARANGVLSSDNARFTKDGRWAIGLSVNKLLDAMEGRPVWLASVSRRSRNGKIVSALKLPQRLVAEAEKVLRMALLGVGDEGRERIFQMCITTCMHRALSPEEIAALPAGWMELAPKDIAGMPVRVLSAKGVKDTPSVQPCVAYLKKPIPGLFDADDEPLWIPIECGECESCRARAC